jgi:hypothetical protein
MPDWLEPTFLLFPFAAWMFWGVGIPWALALLPRDLWRERITVIAVSMALGPLIVTAWMFALGTFGRITLAATLIGSLALAGIGAGIAWRRASPHPESPRQSDRGGFANPPLQSRGERLIIIGLIALLIANVIVTAYWPFIAYDTQWVYGYNARIFVRDERIPDDMGYYPQLIPLSYTYFQQAWGLFHAPAINDHAARVVVPWFNAASVLMAYVLGKIALGGRRVALLTAAVWAFYPHAAAWAGAGDLEITLTLYCTGAAAFFIAAWRSERAREAILSGALLSGALWTKPTGGALALGVMLAVAGYAAWTIRNRLKTSPPAPSPLSGEGKLGRQPSPLHAMQRGLRGEVNLLKWPLKMGFPGKKFRVALTVGLASMPLGGMWYARNMALGHTAVAFPADYWHNFAQRSGQEFGWPLVIAALVAGGLFFRRRPHPLTSPLNPLSVDGEGTSGRLILPLRWRRGRQGVRFLPLLALLFLLIGALPTALNPDAITQNDNLWQWVRGDLFAARRLNMLEAALIVAGFALLAWIGRDRWRALTPERRVTIGLIWALLLPYGVVWFFNFSYHYRLSFAIVPLFAVQVAVLIDGWLWDRLAASRIGRAAGALMITAAAGIALAAALQHSVEAWRDGGLPDDTAKYDRGNPALMVVVHALEAYAAEHGEPVVAIPGEDRLPFFFLDWDIRNSREPDQIPTSVEDLNGADIYVESSPGRFLMQVYDLWPNSLSADAATGAAYYERKVGDGAGVPWPTVLQPIPIGVWGGVPYDDGNFRYSMFAVHPEARSTPMNPGAKRADTEIFGDFARFIGYDVVTLRWVHKERVILTLYWQPTDQAPPPRDYSLYIYLLTPDGEQIAQWDGAPLLGAYPTRFWRPGESLLDYWILKMPAEVTPGPAHLRIGIYDPLTNERLPVTINGEIVGDGLTIDTRIEVQ